MWRIAAKNDDSDDSSDSSSSSIRAVVGRKKSISKSLYSLCKSMGKRKVTLSDYQKRSTTQVAIPESVRTVVIPLERNIVI